MAKAIMVQGTMSNAGKSLLAAGLCRIFKQDGYRVAPFKSQNLALNSFITEEGLEMGRAQVMQAEAAGIKPSVLMNPILLKPTNDVGSQVIVNGEVLGDTAFTVDIPMPGRHMVYNALAAAAVGNIYGLTTEQIKAGIESLEPISGRFRMIETDKFLIVDDCYNANPMSMKASLDVLQDGAGRRIAVLGDMGELGENEVQLHEEVGEHAGKCDIDVLICTGKLCRNMAERAQRTNPDLKVIYEPDRESLLEHLEGYVQDGDTILVKASHFMKFEEVVTKLENM